MHANYRRDRTGLAAFMIFAHDEIAVLALGAVNGCYVTIMHLDPVGAVIDPAGIRVLHDHHAGGADEIAAVLFVPFRRRDAAQIELVAAKSIVLDRAACDSDRRNRFHLSHRAAPELNEIDIPAGGG